MCISKKVGEKGKKVGNSFNDAVVVQVALNLARGIPGGPLLTVDGGIGDKTIKRIRLFQQKFVRLPNPDGTVDPWPGKTLRALKQRLSPAFTEMKLRGIMPGAKPSDLALFYIPLIRTMEANKINTTIRQAHFLAQLAHESGDLKYREEIASGEAYEGRENLGNTEIGDGTRFKGRGLIQLTGRANYTDFGKSIGENLVDGDNPKKVAKDPRLAVAAAAWYWSKHELNSLADADNVKMITFKINGGYNGLDDRKKRLARAKFFLVV